MTTDTTDTTPTTTEPTPEERAIVSLVNLRAVLDGIPTGAPVPLADVSRLLADDLRRAVDEAERRIADALPPIWAGYARDLANFDRAFANEVENYKSARYSCVDVSELRATDDDGRDDEGTKGWTILRGSIRYEVREVTRYEAREVPRFKASRRSSGVYTVSDLAATAPTLEPGFTGTREEAQAEADRMNAAPGGSVWEVYDYDEDATIWLDDYETPRAVLGLEVAGDDDRPDLPAALDEEQARAIAAALNEEEPGIGDVARWIVWDTDNRERASGGPLEDCGRDSYDTSDESSATEAAQAGNVEDYRTNANGWPWAQTSGYPIDKREADDFDAAGFVVATHEPSGQTYAGIDGGNYSMLDAHWAPLYAARMAGRYGSPVRTAAGLRRLTPTKEDAAPRWIVVARAGAWDVDDTIAGRAWDAPAGLYPTQAEAQAHADERNARGY